MEQEEYSLIPPKHWFQRWWGRLVIVVGSVFCLFLLSIVGITARYWWQIRHGIQPAVVAEWQNQFTAFLPAHQSGVLDRALIERVDEPFLGRPGAPVTIVEFVDFKCPNSRIAAPVMKQVIAKYGSKVKFIFRNFPPDDSIHPGATDLARLGRCAYKQGRFWPMHDFLFGQFDVLPEKLTPSDMQSVAEQTTLDYETLKKCLADPATDQAISRDYIDGVGYGIAGTPTFFINGQKVEGAIPFATWQQYLDKVVSK